MLNDKKILVLGAGGLLGAHVVDAALKNGASIIATDVNITAMEERLKQIGLQLPSESLELYVLDVTNEEDVKVFFGNQTHLGGVVNCTYPRGDGYGKHFYDVSLASFNENVSLLLGSAFLVMQQCAAYFSKMKSPLSLVNISSIYGVVAPKFEIYEGTAMTTPVEYAAVKSAIVHLNKYVSKYVKNSDFRVNSVSPGGVFDSQPESFLNEYMKKTNGAGMLAPEDVVSTILFLLSDESKYITGQNLLVDDGFFIS